MTGLALTYLPANQCWMFAFGDAPVSMADRLLFETRSDAVEAARQRGLVVHPNGRTEAVPATQPRCPPPT